LDKEKAVAAARIKCDDNYTTGRIGHKISDDGSEIPVTILIA
jgi:hypothetical protein